LLPQAAAQAAFLAQAEDTTMKIDPWLRNSIIVFCLLFIAGCTNHQRTRNESALKEDLYHMRSAIDQYTQDKSMAPQHLTDLVAAGYLHTIPKDPFTNSATTWIEVREDATESIDPTHPGISDVHSGSAQVSSEGTRYSIW
jgi:general secretion pathway protein G